MSPARDRQLLVIAAVVTGAAALRLIGLDTFPLATPDEGLWTNSAKNFVAHGDWDMDGRGHGILTPVFHSLSVVSFWLFGPSLASARAVSALASTVSVLLLYALVLRSTGQRQLALISSVIMGASGTYVYAARQALIEPTQVMWLLLAAWLLARRDMTGAVAGGVAYGLALLTKINLAIVAPALILFTLTTPTIRSALTDRGFWIRVGAFGAVAAVLAGGVNYILFLQLPGTFRGAYLFELQGAHFQANPMIRLGRIGLDPVMAGRSLLELLREAPFQMVLCALGAVLTLARRSWPHPAWVAWLVIPTAFVLVQLYQPLRYYLLAAPAFSFFAALAVHALVEDARGGDIRRPLVGVLALYALFNVSSLMMNAFVNYDPRVRIVREWTTENLDPDDRVVAAEYLCTDIPNRAYGQHVIGAWDFDVLRGNLVEHEIDYIIWDDLLWAPEEREILAAEFELVHEWPFGAVFRVSDP